MDVCASSHKHFTITDLRSLYGHDVTPNDLTHLGEVKDVLNTMFSLKSQLEHRIVITLEQGLEDDHYREPYIPNYIGVYRDIKRCQLTEFELGILTALRQQHLYLIACNKKLIIPFKIKVTFPEELVVGHRGHTNKNIFGRRYHKTQR